MGKITEYNEKNADINDFIGKSSGNRADNDESNKNNGSPAAGSETCEFPAYKEDPVLLSGFMAKVTIMHSKEKPKKIGITGSDGETYNFLLKCDKSGDLRKE